MVSKMMSYQKPINMNTVQKNCIKLDEKISNLQNAIYVLLIIYIYIYIYITACRKCQFIAKIRTSDYNWLIEKGRHE